jgi:hypothetical protein
MQTTGYTFLNPKMHKYNYVHFHGPVQITQLHISKANIIKLVQCDDLKNVNCIFLTPKLHKTIKYNYFWLQSLSFRFENMQLLLPSYAF